MIESKLIQAKEAIEVRVQYAPERAEETFIWQMEMLQKQSDIDVMAELASWWITHPFNQDKW